MKRLLPILAVAVSISGCVKTNSPLPRTDIDQHQDLTQTSDVCWHLGIKFPHFIFHGDEASDSIQWFSVRNWDTTFLGTVPAANIPINPLPDQVFRYEFHGNDTTYGRTWFGLCYRALYIPNSFRPYHGQYFNPTWRPIFYNHDVEFATMEWRITSSSGVELFRTSDYDGAWDGYLEGNLLPPGPYLYHIEIEVPNEGIYDYTGVVSLLE